MFKRSAYKKIFNRLKEPRRFIQVLSGPRQVGKTTMIQQVMDEIGIPGHYVSADAVSAASSVWLSSSAKRQGSNTNPALIIETTISKDIFMMTRVDKPALLRNLFNEVFSLKEPVLLL